jgi:hypothetical protein
MGGEARCCPCHSAAHCRHIKRQPCLCHNCPHRGCRHCNRRCHLHCLRQLHHHCRYHWPLPLPLTIAVAVAFNHCRCCLCCVAVSHRPCRCRRPCHRPLPSLSPSVIVVAISIGHHHTVAIGHFQELLPWRGKNCIQPIEAKNAYLILFCLDSGRRTDQSWMTDQVSCGNGQHQRWAASSKH